MCSIERELEIPLPSRDDAASATEGVRFVRRYGLNLRLVGNSAHPPPEKLTRPSYRFLASRFEGRAPVRGTLRNDRNCCSEESRDRPASYFRVNRVRWLPQCLCERRVCVSVLLFTLVLTSLDVSVAKDL